MDNTQLNKEEIRNFINKSYKSWKNKFVIISADKLTIAIADLSISRNFKGWMVAKKLINKYNVGMVTISAGLHGNVDMYTRTTLNNMK